MSLNQFIYSLPAAIEADVNTTLAKWQRDDMIARIWAKDASVWTDEDEAKWLGWLSIVGEELADTQKYADLTKDIDDAGFTDVLLMGMGGSSLCLSCFAGRIE